MNTYISTGKKILRHLDKLKKFQEFKIIEPISLQIAPTSRCNLNCCFCSNVNRTKHEDLNFSKIIEFVNGTNPLTVEWTGGRRSYKVCRHK
jgi:sulfatase maturation enzyme AslB (radical SAM superfamily)